MRIKRYRKSLVAVLAISMTMSLAPTILIQAARVGLSVEGCVLSKGDRINIDVKNREERDGVYQSSNKKVATVSKDGIIKAKRVGAAQISWTKGKKRYVCSIIVGKAPEINKTKITVKEGKQKKISISKFGNFELKAAWDSNHPEIAVVKNGKVIGISEGTTTIHAIIKGYTKSYKRAIMVTVVKNKLDNPYSPDLPNWNLVEKLPESTDSETESSSSTGKPTIEVVTESGLDIEKLPVTDVDMVTKEAIITNSSIKDNIVTDASIIAGTENKDEIDNRKDDIANSVIDGSLSPEETKLPNKENSDHMINNPEKDNPSDKEEPKDVVTNSSIVIDKEEKPNPDDDPTISEKSMAELVTELVNKERAANHLPELTLDIGLTTCAEIRAEELIDVFEHIRPDDTLCFTVLDENNISYRVCAENIAMGQKTPEDVMNSWMNSTGHRNNILSSRYGKIGVGYFQLGKDVYWVQLFTD